MTPRWQDGLPHGHTVVWLPDAGELIDVTADQFPPLDESLAGPVITPAPAPAERATGFDARITHGGLVLRYTLEPWHTTRDVLDHPLVRDEATAYQQPGIHVAAAAVGLLTEVLTPRRTPVLAHDRTAALITAARRTTPIDDPVFYR